jgi:lipopolysaccharide export system protein LptA
MKAPRRSFVRLPGLAVFMALLVGGTHTAADAERADRLKPLNVEADLPGKIDLLKQIVIFNGNVVVTKGTMTIRAARIEVRETPDGYHTAVAFGAPGKTATFRQKRDGVDEYIEGEAERLEYDGKNDIVRFVNRAAVRRLRGANVADEITGNLVTYDSLAEVFSVSGGGPATASNPGGRVRAVLVPREAATNPGALPRRARSHRPAEVVRRTDGRAGRAPRRRQRGGRRPARAEWRRQDDQLLHDRRPGPGRRRRDHD